MFGKHDHLVKPICAGTVQKKKKMRVLSWMIYWHCSNLWARPRRSHKLHKIYARAYTHTHTHTGTIATATPTQPKQKGKAAARGPPDVVKLPSIQPVFAAEGVVSARQQFHSVRRQQAAVCCLRCVVSDGAHLRNLDLCDQCWFCLVSIGAVDAIPWWADAQVCPAVPARGEIPLLAETRTESKETQILFSPSMFILMYVCLFFFNLSVLNLLLICCLRHKARFILFPTLHVSTWCVYVFRFCQSIRTWLHCQSKYRSSNENIIILYLSAEQFNCHSFWGLQLLGVILDAKTHPEKIG